MLQNQKIKSLSIAIPLVAILLILSIMVLRSIAMAVVTGLLLAYVFYPVHKKLLKLIKSQNLSALFIVVFILAALIIPLWYLFPILARQIIDLYIYIQKINLAQFLEAIFPELKGYSQNITLSFGNLISDITKSLLTGISNVILDLPNILLQITVIFFIFFFGLRDGEYFVSYIKSISPFTQEVENDLIKKFGDMTNSVIYGHIVVGIIQGILTGIGLFVFGIPHALFFTLIAIILSIIPFLGSWLVWIPASIYLLVSGETASGIALMIYGGVVISWIDNIMRPYIVARKTKMSSAVIFVGMIGGLIAFGVLGVLIGPLVLAYVLLILEFYRKKAV